MMLPTWVAIPPHVPGDFHQLVGDVPVAGVPRRLHFIEHVRHPHPVGPLRALGQPEDLDPVVFEVVQVVRLRMASTVSSACLLMISSWSAARLGRRSSL